MPVVSSTTGSPAVTTGVTYDSIEGTRYVFTGAGSITFSTGGTVYHRLIAGGASGGGSEGGGTCSGGGGAGGAVPNTAALGSFSSTASEYTVAVGAGGAAVTGWVRGNNGGNTSLTGTNAPTAAVGGGAGAGSWQSASRTPNTGGSGGGGGGEGAAGTSGEGAAGTSGQGFAGGNGANNGIASGAGGGATAVGGNAVDVTGGQGGAGVLCDLMGVTYSAGGVGGITDTPGPGYPGQNPGDGGGFTRTTAASGVGAAGVLILFVPDEVGGGSSGSFTIRASNPTTSADQAVAWNVAA